MSSTYHPQSDVQTERLDHFWETYLRCLCSKRPKKWYQWLAMEQWQYNSMLHSSIRMSPFKVTYGHPPVQVQFYQLVSGGTGDLQQFVQSRASMLAAIKVNLTLAKERMKHFADLKRSGREFTVGGWVFLKSHPYKQSSLAMRINQKLAPRFYGPFQISSNIGQVAHKLNLPLQSLIHPTFHVSLLKRRWVRHM